MYIAGQGFSYWPFNRKHPREQQWRVGVQRQLSPNMSVEAFYWGEWGDHLAVSQNLQALPAQYWNTTMVRNNTLASNMTQNVSNPFNINNFASLKTSNPALYQQMSTLGFFTSSTIQKNRLLRAYPQINGLSTSQYYGEAKNNSLQVIFQRRLSKGFNFTANYTYSNASNWTTIINEFDPAPRQWTPTNIPLPNRFNVTGIYEFPFGHGPGILEDWNSQPRGGQLAGGFDLRLPAGPVPYLGQQLLLRRPEHGRRDADSRHEDPGSMVQHQRAVREEFRQSACVIPGARVSRRYHQRAGRRAQPVECQPPARLPIAGRNDL